MDAAVDRQIQGDLDRREAARAAATAKAKAEATRKAVAQDIWSWCHGTGSARLAVVVSWAGKGLPSGAVRLERLDNGRVQISATRGAAGQFKVGDSWVIGPSSVPVALRPVLVRAGWIEKSALPKRGGKGKRAA